MPVSSGGRLSTGLGASLGLVFCDHSAVTMRVGAGLTRTEFTFLSGSSPTGRTRIGQRLFEAEFFFHREERMLQRPCAGMVNFEPAGRLIMVRAFDGTIG